MANVGVIRYDAGAKAFYVDIPAKDSPTGKREKIFSIPVLGGRLLPCKSEDWARALKDIINSQITQGIFRPERFRRRKPLHMKAFAREWLKNQSQLMEATRSSYTTIIENHVIPHLGHFFLDDITEGILGDYIKKDLAGLSPKTKVNVIGLVMEILRDAKAKKHISILPEKPRMTAKNKVIDPEIVWIEPDVQNKILDAMLEMHRGIYMFMMLSGVRPSEARALQWSDIKWSRKEILIANTVDIKGNIVPVKGKKILPIPMTESLTYLLENTPKNLSPYVFPNPRTGRVYRRDAMDKIWRKACKKGIGHVVKLYHATRHSYASQLVNAGMDISAVQRLLRHTDARTTRRYYEYKTEPLRVKLDQVTDIMGARRKIDSVSDLEVQGLGVAKSKESC